MHISTRPIQKGIAKIHNEVFCYLCAVLGKSFISCYDTYALNGFKLTFVCTSYKITYNSYSLYGIILANSLLKQFHAFS